MKNLTIKSRLKIKQIKSVVNTPAFANCDNEGKQFDEEIGKQLFQLFETEVTELNAICLVVNSCIPRLTQE